MKNLLVLFGGAGSEHDISLITCDFVCSQIDTSEYNILKVEIKEAGLWLLHDKDKSVQVELDFKKNLKTEQEVISKIDIALPCIHGYPAETGDIQSFFELIKLPYFGVESEASKICFNKVLTKLWLKSKDIPTAPFIFLSTPAVDNSIKKQLTHFLEKNKKVFIKASNQGSSIGCFSAESFEELTTHIEEAFKFSSFVLIEPFIKARELEVSVFEFDGQVQASKPGEIICPSEFYDYNQKYAKDSQAQINVQAENIDQKIIDTMKEVSINVFNSFKLRDLSRVDFFLTQDNDIYINEINTFPGMTPISLFPQMMEASGVSFKEFLSQRLKHKLNT